MGSRWQELDHMTYVVFEETWTSISPPAIEIAQTNKALCNGLSSKKNAQ
jgi:hypothetical protein